MEPTITGVVLNKLHSALELRVQEGKDLGPEFTV